MAKDTERLLQSNRPPAAGAQALPREGMRARLLRRFDNAPIRDKVLAGFLAIVAIAIVTGIAPLVTALVAREASGEVYGMVMPLTEALGDIDAQTLRLVDHVDQALGSDRIADGAATPEVADLRQRLLAAQRAYRNVTIESEDALELKLADVQVRLLAAVDTFMGEVDAAFSSGEPQAAADRVDRAARSVAGLVREGRGLISLERDLETTRMSWATWVLIATVIFGTLTIVGCAIVGGRLIAARIGNPIRRLEQAASRLGEGDFSAFDHEPQTAEEVGRLVAAFKQTARKLHDMQDRLARNERLSALGQIAGSVSHELRNPLATIHNSAEIIRDRVADKNLGVERALDRLERGVERCKVIVSDILEFSSTRELNREATAIDVWLGEMLDEHDVGVAVTLDRDFTAAATVMLDRTRFRQVLVNLVDNAVQAMTDASAAQPVDRRPRIIVRTEAAGPHLRLTVADNGPGIPEDRVQKIFEPLFTTKAKGSGLGLPTVRNLVEQHGGTIAAESKVGEGTTFTIWLPRTAAPAGAAVSRATAAA